MASEEDFINEQLNELENKITRKIDDIRDILQ